ncbi:MAG: ester cyclase [Burkholderiales bacterium]|nr:ester cyclase [Burkholderiales bacterium]
MNHADPNRTGELARNVAVALRFKQSQGTSGMPQVEKEVLAPNYDRVRGGNLHLAANARDQDFSHPGLYLRKAIPDRVDVIEEVIAEGDRVGLLFRVTGTHTGGFFGIEPAGRGIDVHEVALLRIVDGRMVEGWFMMDEIALMKQMGATMPRRPDGRIVAPLLPTAGEDADACAQRLASQPVASEVERRRFVVARSRGSTRSKADRAADHQLRRFGFVHMRDYCRARGLPELDLEAAIPDRRDRVEVLMAEGDQVWMRFSTSGTHKGPLCGLAPTGRRVGISVVSIMKFAGNEWKESWTFADELGMLLQLGQPNLLLQGGV